MSKTENNEPITATWLNQDGTVSFSCQHNTVNDPRSLDGIVKYFSDLATKLQEKGFILSTKNLELPPKPIKYKVTNENAKSVKQVTVEGGDIDAVNKTYNESINDEDEITKVRQELEIVKGEHKNLSQANQKYIQEITKLEKRLTEVNAQLIKLQEGT